MLFQSQDLILKVLIKMVKMQRDNSGVISCITGDISTETITINFNTKGN